MLLSAAVEDYGECIWREVGHSRNTYLNYRMRLREFHRWLVDQGRGEITLQEIDYSLIRSYYLTHLLEARTPQGELIKKNTLRGHLHALRFLFSYYYNQQVLDHNPAVERDRGGKIKISLPIVKDAHQEWVSDDQLLQLLEAAHRQRSEFKIIRDTAVISTLGYTGLRRTELLNLQVTDIDLPEARLVVRSGKGSVRRTLALCPEVLAALTQWMDYRQTAGISQPRLFTADRGRPLGECGLVTLLQETAIRAGMPAENNIQPHAFRRGAATRLFRAKRDLILCQQFLGHTNIKTTMVYLQVGDELLRDNVDGLSTAPQSSPGSNLNWRP